MELYSPMLHELIQRFKYFCPWLSYEKRFRFGEVDRQKLYRSAQPTPQALRCFVEKYKIQSLAILLEDFPEWEKDFAETAELKILQIQISGRPPTNDEVGRFFNFVADHDNQPTMVHCVQGRDRTGLFCFLYRVEKMGWRLEMAWAEMLSFGHRSLPWHKWTMGFIKDWLEKKYGPLTG